MNQRRMWGDKPYYSLNYYLKEIYGKRIYKLSLNGGMSCPNRDGTLATGGCIFCSQGGSGDFAADGRLTITEQIESQIALMEAKMNHPTDEPQYIAYFQAYTNTYGEVSYLRKIFYEAICHPSVILLSIATRPDCLSQEVLDLLQELNQIKPVWIELGLQTIHDRTAAFIHRGYPLSCFDTAIKKLSEGGLTTIVHVILGLPGESHEDILQTIKYLNTKPIQGIKLQLLHILRGTALANMADEIPVYSMEEYALLLTDCINALRPDIVIHRITGDGPKDLLIAPTWSLNKKNVLNYIHKTLKEQQAWQGKTFKEVSH